MHIRVGVQQVFSQVRIFSWVDQDEVACSKTLHCVHGGIQASDLLVYQLGKCASLHTS